MSFLGALGSWLVGDGPNGRDGRDDHSQGLEETRLAEAHPGTASLLGRALGATVGVVATSVRRSIAANVGDGLLSAEVARIEADARSGQAASKIDGWLTRVNHEDGHMRYRVDTDDLALNTALPYTTARGCFLFSDALVLLTLNRTVPDEALHGALFATLEINAPELLLALRATVLRIEDMVLRAEAAAAAAKARISGGRPATAASLSPGGLSAAPAFTSLEDTVFDVVDCDTSAKIDADSANANDAGAKAGTQADISAQSRVLNSRRALFRCRDLFLHYLTLVRVDPLQDGLSWFRYAGPQK
eukprot:gene457-24_t